MAEAPTLVWFRQDLRLDDHPALTQAAEGPVLPVYLWSPEDEGSWPPGAASRWWLHHSLAQLQAALAELGSPLILRTGRAAEVLPDLAEAIGARRIVWTRRHEPAALATDRAVMQVASARGLAAEACSGALLFEPETIRTQGGAPFQVFTPFWRRCLQEGAPEEPLPPPRRLRAPEKRVESVSLESLELLPKIAWYGGLEAEWKPGFEGAGKRVAAFLHRGIEDYSNERNRADHVGTSRLSPHLHFGEISPRRLWHTLRGLTGQLSPNGKSGGADAYLRELGWREFAQHLLHHFPETANAPLRTEFEHFPWRRNRQLQRAWQRGLTGYPLVDAGMRELWATGWMHNRVRMITASFLVKDLMIPWQEGARWFWETLVDADLANNTLGWQWTAGCGADAAPFFRIFNPVTQATTCDPSGDYTARWVPELRELDPAVRAAPWKAGPLELAAGGLELGIDYPKPVVDHAAARARALAAFRLLRH